MEKRKISVTVTQEDYDVFKAYCDADERTISQLFRKAASQYVRKNRKKDLSGMEIRFSWED